MYAFEKNQKAPTRMKRVHTAIAAVVEKKRAHFDENASHSDITNPKKKADFGSSGTFFFRTRNFFYLPNLLGSHLEVSIVHRRRHSTTFDIKTSHFLLVSSGSHQVVSYFTSALKMLILGCLLFPAPKEKSLSLVRLHQRKLFKSQLEEIKPLVKKRSGNITDSSLTDFSEIR